MARKNPDERTDARMHIHRTKIVTAMFLLTASGFDIKVDFTVKDLATAVTLNI